jgi:hypothetical protein
MVPFLGRYKEMSIPFIGKLYFLIDMDVRAQQYLSERHKPVYYLGATEDCKGKGNWLKSESYFFRSAKRFYVEGNGGLYLGRYYMGGYLDERQILPPTEDGFRRLKYYKDLHYYSGGQEFTYYIKVLKYASYLYGAGKGDNIIYTHVLPIGWFSHTKLGARYPNWFKIQYFTFFDFSNGPGKVCADFIWKEGCADHEGDWEWTCHFVEFGRILYTIYHYHGDKKKICSPGLPSSLKEKCDDYPLPLYESRIPQRGEVYIEAQAHGSRWKVGCGWDIPFTTKDANTGRDYKNDNPYLKVVGPLGDDEQQSVYWFGGKWGDSKDSPPGPRFKDWDDTKW